MLEIWSPRDGYVGDVRDVGLEIEIEKRVMEAEKLQYVGRIYNLVAFLVYSLSFL
jgi:hypothetical protein